VLFTILLCGFGIPQSTTTLGSVSECVTTSSERTECGPDDPAAPAAAAGLQPGDRLVSIDGIAVTSWNQATAIIRDSPDEEIAFVVVRDGEQLTLPVTPLLNARWSTIEEPR
jgi:membrane-associated protease RseP (regulator of RpoE activity)